MQFKIGNLMFIQSLGSISKYSLSLRNFISFNLSHNKNNMSTLENIIDGLNDVKCRIKTVVSKQKRVFHF